MDLDDESDLEDDDHPEDSWAWLTQDHHENVADNGQGQ